VMIMVVCRAIEYWLKDLRHGVIAIMNTYCPEVDEEKKE
jgi:hypothetical protein